MLRECGVGGKDCGVHMKELPMGEPDEEEDISHAGEFGRTIAGETVAARVGES
jgi:hypothetical protein